MEQIKWIDRKFPHSFDRGYTPLFIERLRGTASRMEELLKQVTEEQASTRYSGGWSVKEHAAHLTDLEVVHLGRIEDYKTDREVLRAADMTNKATHEANHNATASADILRGFRESRNHFLDTINALPEALFYRKALHPRLQMHISITDMLHFVAEHDVHHLSRMAHIVSTMR